MPRPHFGSGAEGPGPTVRLPRCGGGPLSLGHGPAPALAARKLLLEHLVLVLELPLGFGNFELPSTDLLWSGVLPEWCDWTPAAVLVLGVADGSSPPLADWTWPSGVSAMKHS